MACISCTSVSCTRCCGCCIWKVVGVDVDLVVIDDVTASQLDVVLWHEAFVASRVASLREDNQLKCFG